MRSVSLPLAVVLMSAAACTERPVAPDGIQLQPGADVLVSASSLTGCGANVTTIASMSIPADPYGPASTVTDTVTTCLTWTGNDYTTSITLNGTSDVKTLHDPRGTYAFANATVTGPTTTGQTSTPAEASNALDFVNASADVRAAVAADPYFMYRSCPVVMPPPPSGGIGGPPILPSTGDDLQGDPCGSQSGIRAGGFGKASSLQISAAKQRRASAQDSLLKGLRRVARVDTDGVIRYTGVDGIGGEREVRVHPTARVVLSEERRNGREYGRKDFDWRRTPNGFVRVGERVTEDILMDGKLVRVTSAIRHSAIRIQLD